MLCTALSGPLAPYDAYTAPKQLTESAEQPIPRMQRATDAHLGGPGRRADIVADIELSLSLLHATTVKVWLLDSSSIGCW